MKSMIVAFMAFTMLACKGEQEKKSDVKPDESEAAATSESEAVDLEEGCYSYDGNGGTVLFEITRTGNPVVGDLTYAYSGKDRNTGQFKGTFKDDKLIGTYSFKSEGKESSREVAFLLKGNHLVEGYGELSAGGTVFRDRESISYSSTMPLDKKNCEK